ncbi:SRPBCC family protein [Streptomyces sp. NPDC005423]|uniref:SRPBCC family protein n=1 Tax=Streptomyces sp. NPDC005423 TaxID=3155343 RepID=UPI0033A44AFB
MISIAEKIAVPSPPDRVWEIISDPSAVVSCIGGAELGQSHDDGSFDGVLVVKFGGIRVRFAARITLELDEAEREGRLTARGRDGQGATRFSGGAVFRVSDDPAADGTQVAVTGEMNLSGKLAPLIESGAGVVVTRMTREFSAALIERCALPDPTAPLATVPLSDISGSTAPAPTADGSHTAAVPAARPGLWRRIRDRLTRLFGRDRSLPAAGAQPVSESVSTPYRGERP